MYWDSVGTDSQGRAYALVVHQPPVNLSCPYCHGKGQSNQMKVTIFRFKSECLRTHYEIINLTVIDHHTPCNCCGGINSSLALSKLDLVLVPDFMHETCLSRFATVQFNLSDKR